MADVVAKFKMEDGSELSIDKSFISSLKSVSESTTDAGSINYGTLANTGSIEIQDGNGYISKMIDDGSLPASNLDVVIELNGSVFQNHITTDSDYYTDDNTLNISLSNKIKDLDVLKYNGYVYKEKNVSLYDLFYDVLSSCFNILESDMPNVFDEKTLEYIKNIYIEYPSIEAGKTYRQVLDELCTVAQLNMFATKDNSIKFVSARPVYNNGEEIKTINLGNIVKDLKYTKTLKNKFDGVDINNINPKSEIFYDTVVFSEDNVSTLSVKDSMSMSLNDLNTNINGNRGVDVGIINDSKLKYDTHFVSATKIKNYYIEGDLTFDESTNNNLSKILSIKNEIFKTNSSGSKTPLFTIKYDKYTASASATINSGSSQASSLSISALNYESDGSGYFEQSVTHSFSPNGYSNTAKSTATETDSSYVSVNLKNGTYYVHYKILCGQDVLYLGGEASDSYILTPPTSLSVPCSGKFIRYEPKSIEFSLYGNKRVISFETVSASTKNIQDKKTKASVMSSSVLQTTTTYNGNMLSDIIKENILTDYRNGISDGTMTLNKDLVEIGDLIKYPNDRRVWKVVGKEFVYDGEYLFPISVMQCLIAPSGYGVYDDNGYLLYDWNDLVESGIIAVEDGSVNYFDKTITGNLTIPNTITKIGNNAFNSSKLKSIEISSSVTDIGDRAFEYCSQATKISIPDSVKSIGYGAFSRCSLLETINLGPDITVIGNSCFSGCYNLKSISIKGKITSIGANAFDECRSLVIEIPTTVTEIGNYAFYGCRSITSVTVPSGVEQLGAWTFASCSKLDTVNLTNNITRMGKGCFADTIALKSITIPTSLLFIQEQLFVSSGLTSITIPTNIKFIGSNAFAGCEKLTTATFKSPNGWVIGTGESLNLSNASTSALYLRETYAGQEWTQY